MRGNSVLTLCSKIIERLDAVEEIHQEFNETLTKLVKLLKKLPDLERGICRIYYKRCSIQEFVAVLQAYKTYVKELKSIQANTTI